MLSRPGRARHVGLSVLVLLVLVSGLTAASRLAPQTTHAAALPPPAPPAAAAPVLAPVPVALVRPVAAPPHRTVAPERVVKRPVRHAVVRRTARVSTRAVAPAPAFGAAEAQRRGRAAYASLGRRLPAGWVMRFKVYDGGYQGLADSGRRVVTVWVRPADTQGRLRITVAHEMGHVLDYTTLTDHDRGRYLSLRGRSGSTAPWYPGNGTSDYASPAGDFAEVYALHLAGAGDFRSTFAPQPTSAQLSSLASFFDGLEARHP